MSTVPHPAALAPLTDRLGQLRARLARWIMVDGLRRLAMWLLAVIAADFAVDWLFEMDRPQRLVMLLLAVGLLLVVLVSRLVRPLLERPSDDALCLMVQRRRGLGESLISALQLSRIPDPAAQGISPLMVQAAIQEGLGTASQIKVDDILDRNSYRRNLILLVATGLGLAGIALSVAATETMSVWFDRNVLLADRSWPQDVYLVIEGSQQGPLRVPRGSDWPVSVTVAPHSRRLPEEVTLEIAAEQRVRYESLRASEDRRQFDTLLSNVSQPLRLRAVSGRAHTGWVDVELVEYPALQDISLEITAPDYAGGKRNTLQPRTAQAPAVEGSHLTVRGQATKPLATARLIKVTQSGTADEASAYPMTLSSNNQFQLDLQLALDTAGMYAIELTDAEQILRPGAPQPENLTNRQAGRFAIRVRRDRVPKIKLQRGRIGRMIVPEARIPFTAEIEEDFGLAAVRVVAQWAVEGDSDAAPPDPRSLSVDRQDVVTQLKDGRLVFRHVTDLVEANLPVGANLQIAVEADDNNTLSGPGQGKSAALRFRVVTRDELRTDLLQRESVLREAVRGEQQKQIAILADSQDLLRFAETNPQQTGQQQTGHQQIVRLAQLQKRQKQLAVTLAGIGDRVDMILAELEHNRLDSTDGTHHHRLHDHVLGPLRDLVDRSIPAAIRHLDGARRSVEQAAALAEALAKAIELQTSIDQQLGQVIDHMVQDVNFQLALDLLREIQGNQQDVLKRSEAERLRLIQQLLDNEGHGGNQPPQKND